MKERIILCKREDSDMVSVTRRCSTRIVTAIGLVTVVSFCLIGNVAAETSGLRKLQIPQQLLEKAPEAFRNQFIPKLAPPHYVAKSSGHYSPDDWRSVIDATWGAGPSASVKATRFDYFWNVIDERYACFHGLTVNWDSIGNMYSSEIAELPVSRGRFAAIMNHSTRVLKEGHTQAWDSAVYFTELAPGVPLMYVGGWGNNDHFGAGLTPLPDSSLLVYTVVDDHPLGLEPGDIVLGYDGVPWKQLYRELLDAELPTTGFWWGSSKSSHTHSFLMAAGLNWHLFDTIDIVKYATGDTIHLATDALVGQEMSLFATEQLDIPGVPKPDLSYERLSSWGIIENTQIGYVYCMGWFTEESEFDWLAAIASGMYGTNGMIIDLRTNYGGYLPAIKPGLELLFSDTVDVIGAASRSDPDDHLSMEPSSLVSDTLFFIYADSSSYYDKPIAVLIGPGAISGGDYTALMLSFHPRVKLFGKPTSASFNSPEPFDGGSDFMFRYARIELYLLSNPDHYLTHDEFPSAEDFPWVAYQEVWLTPDGVAQGKDDVVEAAIAWITLTTDVENEPKGEIPDDFTLSQNYPNPFNPATTIPFSLSSRTHVVITVYNVVGQRVTTLVDEIKPPGSYHITWDGTNQRGETVASGVYLYELRAGEYVKAKKMLLLK